MNLSSFHGGHSMQFCTHASGDLESMIKTCIAKNYSHFGITEHAPRYQEKHLLVHETKGGYTLQKLTEIFDSYVKKAFYLKEKYQDQLHLLVSFEAEYFPGCSSEMLIPLPKEPFDYLLSSVHYIQDLAIDYTNETFEQLLNQFDSIEHLSLAYYEYVFQMIKEMKPDLVGHFDLIKKIGEDFGYLETDLIKTQIKKCLDLMISFDCALDFNISPYRRNKKEPYLSPYILSESKKRNIKICFGDDSHEENHLGANYELAINYLRENQIDKICLFESNEKKIIKKEISF